ncbi:8589_t:CDS:2 [Funneliformis caledonium]|uniref:8589_t:CDS:1 n=1 Tax=Funneliformis caledonium TaxID=1117310 RepID=A0A9N8ZBV8_9GLOM|nr:8589_t:CDS:2 [Funneliformis caledonium]
MSENERIPSIPLTRDSSLSSLSSSSLDHNQPLLSNITSSSSDNLLQVKRIIVECNRELQDIQNALEDVETLNGIL